MNIKIFFIIITLSASLAAKCLLDQSRFCRCNQLTVNCSSLDVALDKVLPSLISENVQYLVLRKSWAESSTTTLSPTHISKFSSLQLFDISHNRINYIEAGTFNFFPQLRKIDLSHNGIRLLEKSSFTGYLPNLEYLDLSNNHILALLDNTFTFASSLRQLDLRNNKIVFIGSGSFTHLKRLQILRLNGCNVTSFPSDALLPLSDLTYLQAKRFNHVAKTPTFAFRNNRKLKRLHLEEFYSITSNAVHYVFCGLTSLEQLILIACNLSTVSQLALQSLKNLQYLDLSKNPIEVVYTNDFIHLTKVKTLILKQTGLRQIMKYSFLPLANLRVIDLSGNRLSSLRRDVFPGVMNHIDQMFLSLNPWYCECSISWIAKYRKHIADANKTVCTNPKQYQGYQFTSLSNHNFTCSTSIVRKTISTMLVPQKSENKRRCETINTFRSSLSWTLPAAFTKLSINYSITNKQPRLILNALDDSAVGKASFKCLEIGKQNRKSSRAPSSTQSVSSVPSHKMKSMFFEPATIGIASMISCLGLLTSIVVAVWGCKVKRQNKKLKIQLQKICRIGQTSGST